MALWAALIGAISAPLGVAASYWKDIPTGPSIVLAAIAIFFATTLFAKIADAARARA
jgi:zinc transport system permease protein